MKTQFVADGCHKFAEQDDFARGCLPGAETSYVDLVWQDDTLDGLLARLRAFVGISDSDTDAVSLDACEERGRVDIARTETDDGDEPTEAQKALWRKGNFRLWYCVYTFYVERVTREAVTLTGAPQCESPLN